MLLKLLDQFREVHLKIKQLKILMPVSLALENKGTFNFIESSREHLVPTKFHYYSMSRSKVTIHFVTQHFQ